MKKRLVISASLFVTFVGASAAQAGGNTVYLDQKDSRQSAAITQSGSSNSVGSADGSFVQRNAVGDAVGNNALSVTQSGNGNKVTGAPLSFQTGRFNSAAISQAGTNGTVTIQQVGISNGDKNLYDWAFSKNRIAQTSTADLSSVTVLQNGGKNAFDVEQGNAANVVSLTQTGTGGMALVRQLSGEVDPAGGSSITISQASTTANYAVAMQQFGAVASTLQILQSGDLHSADLRQTGGSGNVAYASQTGKSNRLGASAYLVSTPFTQAGFANALYSTQSDSLNAVNGGQTGNNNTITTTQSGMRQTGVFNQVGIGNVIISTQSGTSDNSVQVTQTGNNHTSSSAQIGSFNTLTVLQTGANNTSQTSQNGSNNSIAIVQN